MRTSDGRIADVRMIYRPGATDTVISTGTSVPCFTAPRARQMDARKKVANTGIVFNFMSPLR
jgi:hypothetical protein